jgi:16S rRNA processing protein RimM
LNPPSADSIPPRRVVVGRIVGAHGIRGEVRVRVLGDGPEHLLAVSGVSLSSRADAPEADPAARACDVDGARSGRPGEVRLTLAGVRDRDAAAALRGTWLLVDADDLPELGEDEHYWYELVGFLVVDGTGARVGRVRELWETAAHDLLVVIDDEGRQHLVPAVDAFVKEIDRDGRLIRIEAIPGLLGDA